VFYYLDWQFRQSRNQLKGECEMPATISGWCMALFFLWFGLSAFVPALNTDMFKKVGAVLAILTAVLPFIGM
jgi:hypothetical protein